MSFNIVHRTIRYHIPVVCVRVLRRMRPVQSSNSPSASCRKRNDQGCCGNKRKVWNQLPAKWKC